MPRILFGLVEAVMLVLFVLSARFAYRSGGRQRLVELLSAVPFGLLLEQGDITIFGSYAYNQGFFIKIGSVPVAIALAWAMIITSSMFMSDRLGIPARLAPFADAVFAILLDLSLDAIAIRQGLWHWNIPLHAGFFGVPAGTTTAGYLSPSGSAPGPGGFELTSAQIPAGAGSNCLSPSPRT